MQTLSCYVLTYNSEKYLDQVLQPLQSIADEIVLLDSGSRDRTEEIGNKYNARFVHRKFDDFKTQRNFAADQCQSDWVLFVDSDEVLDEVMVAEVQELKKNNFLIEGQSIDAFRLKRRWYLFGEEVRAFLPVSSPDFPVRLFNKHKVSFKDSSNLVHETPSGFETEASLSRGAVHHYSCDSIDYLFSKLNQYTTLAAQDMLRKGKKSSWLKCFIHAESAWLTWYFKKGGWRDGQVGFLLGIYAYLYAFMKYLKLLYIQKGSKS